MKNITNILAVILLLFAGFFITACDDEETVVVPDNWVTVSTDPMTIGYEGGSLSCDYVLAKWSHSYTSPESHPPCLQA